MVELEMHPTVANESITSTKPAIKQWADMTADERKLEKANGIANALDAIKTKGFPTGLKVAVGGHEFIARPVRTTGSGGVTYNLAPRPTNAGKYPARLNKFSFTLMDPNGASEVTFDQEDLA